MNAVDTKGTRVHAGADSPGFLPADRRTAGAGSGPAPACDTFPIDAAYCWVTPRFRTPGATRGSTLSTLKKTAYLDSWLYLMLKMG